MSLFAVLLLMLNLLYTAPLGEELGWRGFALPLLLDRFSPVTASLVLGAVWGVWHLPSFFASGLPQSVATLPAFLVAAPLLSIVATWLFIRSGGSVVVSILLHYSVNFSLELLGLPIPALTLVLVVFAVLVVALDRSVGWFWPPRATSAHGISA
jgi:membrane protease YdiL (CAAX protease family)